MSDPRDYYEMLGVARDADEKMIKDAFRQLALKYHPTATRRGTRLTASGRSPRPTPS